ncbi:MAG: DNA primase [Rickettsiales bacterium]|jgi:DNA primase|nr:DNA primase [Rickettsiales bacterium]
MALDRTFIELLKSRLSISEVIGKYVPLSAKGRQYWGCCPFHKEKTPSFSVSEDKGFFHCFGCGAHGGVIDFVMQHQHMSFPEAVEKLAMEAGLEVPKFTPAEAAKAKEAKNLYDILLMAAEYFARELYEPEGAEGLAYLRRRGLTDEIIANFKLGFAPPGNKLVRFLTNKGIEPKQIMAAGLARKSDKDGSAYDYFRSRVMFPITDPRGRIIAFGGRVLDNSEPKYLNSPENMMFVKGANLYALALSRANTDTEHPIIACEGYMDTISLHKFGFTTAIAPLGTAMTEKQIEIIWKISAEPILCFDNDTAGRNASARAALRALPILKPGKSLRFCLIKDAKDPDEFLNAFGAEKFKALLDKSLPLSDVLWSYFTEGRQVRTPEQRAGLKADITREIGRIADESVRTFYTEEFNRREKASFSKIPTAKIPVAPKANPENGNERMILAFAISYPNKFAKLVEGGLRVNLTNAKFKRIFEAVAAETSTQPHTRDTICAFLSAKGFDARSALKFEMDSLAASPDTAEGIMREKAARLSRENLAAEIRELNTKLLTASLDLEVERLRARISALQEELAKTDEIIGDMF